MWRSPSLLTLSVPFHAVEESQQIPRRLEHRHRGIDQCPLPPLPLEVEVGTAALVLQCRWGRPHADAERLELGDVVGGAHYVGPAAGEEVLAVHQQHGVYRACLWKSSTSSSYMASDSASPCLKAWVAQCLRWLRISSRATARNASCTEETWVRMSAQ